MAADMTTTKQVQMKVKDTLTRVGASVNHQAVAALMHALPAGKLLSDNGHAAKQMGIGFLKLIERGDVLVGDDENVHRRCRVRIPKSGHPIIVVKEPAVCLTGDDAAKNAIGRHYAFSPRM